MIKLCCAYKWLSAKEISEKIGRHPTHTRRIIKKLLAEGILRAEHPEQLNHPAQRYRIQELSCTVPKKATKEEVSGKVSGKVSDISKSELSVLRLLSSNNRLTQQTIAEKSGISLGGVKKILASLRRKSLLSREGSDKAGHWVILYDCDLINPK